MLKWLFEERCLPNLQANILVTAAYGQWIIAGANNKLIKKLGKKHYRRSYLRNKGFQKPQHNIGNPEGHVHTQDCAYVKKRHEKTLHSLADRSHYWGEGKKHCHTWLKTISVRETRRKKPSNPGGRWRNMCWACNYNRWSSRSTEKATLVGYRD